MVNTATACGSIPATTLLDHLPLAVLLFDEHAQLCYWNNRTSSVLAGAYIHLVNGLDIKQFAQLLSQQLTEHNTDLSADTLEQLFNHPPLHCQLQWHNHRYYQLHVEILPQQHCLVSLLELPTTETATPTHYLRGEFSASDTLTLPTLTQARKNAAQMLIASTLEAISEAVIAVDNDANLISCNQRYIKLFDLKPEECVIGQNMSFLKQRIFQRCTDGALWIKNTTQVAAQPQLEHSMLVEWLDGRSFEVNMRPLFWQEQVIGRVWTWLDISTQQQIYQSLLSERDRVRQYLDAAEFIVLVLDPQGRINMINRKGCDVLCYQEDELIGSNWFDIALTPNWRARLWPTFETAFTSGELSAGQGEHPIITRHGEERLITWRARFLYKNSDQPIGLLACGEDVSEQRATERALRASDQKFAIAFNTSPDGISITELVDGRYLEINQAFEQLTGYSKKELIGFRINQDIPFWVDSCFYDDFIMQLSNHTHVSCLEGRYYNKHGDIGHVLISASVVHIQEQDCILTVYKEISDRKRAEAALRAQEKQLRGYYDQELVGMIMTRLDGGWIDANRAFCQLLGYTREELFHRPWPELQNLEELSREAAWLKQLETGERDRYSIEKTLKRSDGRYVQVIASVGAVRHSDNRLDCLISVIQDISLQKAQATQLLQAQKMEAVGQLTGGIAHDFNNLLTIISGNLELLQLSLDPDSSQQELIEDALSASHDGSELTRQMLIFSRGQMLEPTLVELGGLILAIERLLRRALRENISLHLDWDKHRHYLALLDKHQFESVLVNLMINARDAMPNGGKVTIALEFADPSVALYLNLPQTQYLQVNVTDTGHGMSAEVLARACEPFFTTKPMGKGTGLGLSMAYTFLKHSAGHLWLESEVGGGTCVHLLLPTAKHASVYTHETSHRPELLGGQEHILVVEDEPRVRELAVRYLRDLGYRVSAVEDAQTALTLLEQDNSIELLFSDIMMPGTINGRQLASLVSTARPNLRVLLTTGFERSSISQLELMQSPWLVLNKPYSRIQLAHMVRQALDKPSLEPSHGTG